MARIHSLLITIRRPWKRPNDQPLKICTLGNAIETAQSTNHTVLAKAKPKPRNDIIAIGNQSRAKSSTKVFQTIPPKRFLVECRTGHKHRPAVHVRRQQLQQGSQFAELIYPDSLN